jgi:hypothetical protein
MSARRFGSLPRTVFLMSVIVAPTALAADNFKNAVKDVAKGIGEAAGTAANEIGKGAKRAGQATSDAIKGPDKENKGNKDAPAPTKKD